MDVDLENKILDLECRVEILGKLLKDRDWQLRNIVEERNTWKDWAKKLRESYHLPGFKATEVAKGFDEFTKK